MYRYDSIDQRLVEQRVAQFRDQTRRFLAGQLSDDDFKSLRLRNGLYIQKHAPMLRVSIPYGLLSTAQVRVLARIAREYDRDYGHFTTRQNIQYNWPKLEQVPDILALLATVEMHAIQTSGNCIRNVTADHLAGVAPDELEDPRPWCEIHPAVGDAASRILVPAAQVQDRSDRLAAGSRGLARARHRLAPGAQRGWRSRASRCWSAAVSAARR